MNRAVWGLTLALSVSLAAILYQSAPVPVRTQASRLHRAQAAPYCEGFTAAGLPCNRRTRHSLRRCPDHRPAAAVGVSQVVSL